MPDDCSQPDKLIESALEAEADEDKTFWEAGLRRIIKQKPEDVLEKPE